VNASRLPPRPPLNLPPRRRQRGVAVITALLLTTLAVAIVASLFWQQQVQVRSMENQRLHLQTKWILRGALDWSTLVLDSFNSSYTSLDQPWATPLEETRLDQYIERERVEGENFDATLSGSVSDACARYNLRNLADENGRNDGQVELFKNLLTNLQLQPTLAVKVADYVAAAQPPHVVPVGDPPPPPAPTPGGGVAGKPMSLLQADDLLAVPGFTPEMVERLRPFVIVLPVGKTKVNVNTAPAELLAALVGGMSVSEASGLVARRKQAPFKNSGEFGLVLGNRTVTDPDSADVTSDWFLVASRIRLDRAALDAEALVHRMRSGIGPGGGTRVEWIRQN
jgi:general secretion pathway protein K